MTPCIHPPPGPDVDLPRVMDHDDEDPTLWAVIEAEGYSYRHDHEKHLRDTVRP